MLLIHLLVQSHSAFKGFLLHSVNFLIVATDLIVDDAVGHRVDTRILQA